MTNHDRMKKAVADLHGRILESSKIADLSVAHGVKEGSVRPNDHALGNLKTHRCKQCDGDEGRLASAVFDRVGKGLYRVR